MKTGKVFEYSILKSFILFGSLFNLLSVPDIYTVSHSFSYALILASLFYFILLILVHLRKVDFSTAIAAFMLVFYLQNLNFFYWSGIDTLLLEWILLFPVVAYSLKRYSILSYLNISLIVIANILFHLGKLHPSYTDMDMFAINLEYILISFVLYSLQKNKDAQSKEILEQKAFLEDIFENSSDGILLIEDGKFIKCNKTLVQMLHCSSSKELLKMYPHDLSAEFQPDGELSRDKAKRVIDIAIDKGSYSLEWVYKRTNGEEFWAEITLNKINVDGRALIHVISRDISKRKNTELALYELNKNLEKRVQEAILEAQEREKILQQQSRLAQMGEMLSMIAHQWRQPLSAISSATIDVELSLLSNEYNLDDSQQRAKFMDYLHLKIKDVSEYVHILSVTIDDFRNFFKPNKNRESTLLRTPINKALKIVQASMDNKKIRIKKEYSCNATLTLFQNEIMQVVLNILKNSEDNFLDRQISNPTIMIRTSEDESSCKLTIEDNGGGIEQDIINKIFDPYFSTKDEKNGTGLGLYMSKIMIEEHNNGRINVSNLNEGVCFEIIFTKS